MNRKQAKNNLIQEFDGLDYLVNRDIPGAGRFYKGEKCSLFLRLEDDYQMILPEEINSVDEISEFKALLKYLRNADDFPHAYHDNKYTQPVEYDTVAVGNHHCSAGQFYPFDNGLLTGNLVNMLVIMKSCLELENNLGVLLAEDSDWYIQEASLWTRRSTFHRENIMALAGWFEDSGVEYYHNLSDTSPFKWFKKGILVKDKEKYHFVRVADGSDDDLVQKYLDVESIKKTAANNPPTLHERNIRLESIIIGTPYSREGYLFRNDRLTIGGSEIDHDLPDYLPAREYLKTFQYARLPFVLFNGDDIPTNILVSTALQDQGSHPLVSMQYKHEGNALHKFYRLPKKGF